MPTRVWLERGRGPLCWYGQKPARSSPASLTPLDSSGLTSCSVLPSTLSALITAETFLSSLPALRLASPLIPAECVECWPTEASSQAARGNRGGNEQQQQTRAPERRDHHMWTYRGNVCHSTCTSRETLPVRSLERNQKSSLGELIESVHIR